MGSREGRKEEFSGTGAGNFVILGKEGKDSWGEREKERLGPGRVSGNGVWDSIKTSRGREKGYGE